MREKVLEASNRASSVELKTVQDDLGKTMTLCVEAVSRAERLKAHNSRLEASIAWKETELKLQAEEVEELKVFKLFTLCRIKDLVG